MMLDKKQIWVIFLLEFKMGPKAVLTTHNINSVFCPGTSNERIVQWWLKMFCKGDESCEDMVQWPVIGSWQWTTESTFRSWSKLVQPLCRTVWRFLKKLEIELPYDPAIPLLGIHTEKTRIERDMCTPMFIAALFIIARTWKQPRCPSADEWIRKLWYIYTMEYYSAIKMNTFESVLMRWMKLEPIIQSEVSQKEKHQYSILMHIYGI